FSDTYRSSGAVFRRPLAAGVRGATDAQRRGSARVPAVPTGTQRPFPLLYIQKRLWPLPEMLRFVPATGWPFEADETRQVDAGASTAYVAGRSRRGGATFGPIPPGVEERSTLRS